MLSFVNFNLLEGVMQDYAKLFQSRILVKRERSAVQQIRGLLLSGLRPEIIVLLIAAVVFPKSIALLLFKR